MSLDVLNLTLVLIAALAGGRVAARMGYPTILGEILAGIVLGPPLLGLLTPDDALAVVGKLGVILLMLYIGLHLDPTDLGKAAKPGALAAFGGFVVPAGLGFALMMVVDGDPIAAIFVAVAMGVTSLATKSRILVDLGILNTRIAHVLLAGALFSDVAALIIFAAVLGLAATGSIALSALVLTAVKAAVFLVGSWVVGTKVFPWAGRRLTARDTEPALLFFGVVLAGFAMAAAADAAGLHAILGAFLAGLYIREGVLPHNHLAEVEQRARSVSVGLLAPVFFVSAGFKVSFSVFTDEPLLLLAVVAVATLGKVVGTALFYIPTGHGFREGIAVGAGMNGRGAVEIIVAELALAAGLIDATVFSILVFMAIFTTATVPVLLTRAVYALSRRGELVADERSGMVIVGAGSLAQRFATLLRNGGEVVFIDTNPDHLREAEALGFRVVKGSGLDSSVLEEANAREAKCLISVTSNPEVNVLAGQIAATRFGIPNVYVAVTEGASGSFVGLVKQFGGRLLFGRVADVAGWEADLHAGRLKPLTYTMAEPEKVLSEGRAVRPEDAEVVTLPLVVETHGGREPFTGQEVLHPDDRVIALGFHEWFTGPIHAPSGSESSVEL